MYTMVKNITVKCKIVLFYESLWIYGYRKTYSHFLSYFQFHRCLLLPWLITTPLMTALSAWSISTVVKKLVAGHNFISFGALENTAFIMFCLIVIVNVSTSYVRNIFTIYCVSIFGHVFCIVPAPPVENPKCSRGLHQ